jgi:FMN-dependent NADH-azoreductase
MSTTQKETIAVILGHPNKKSLNGHLFEIFCKTQKEKGFKINKYYAYEYPLSTCDFTESKWQKEFDKPSKNIQKADYIVIFTPMWNFGITAGLKNFFDSIIRSGKYFKFSNRGIPVGMLKTKKVTTFWTSGTTGWMLRILLLNLTSLHIKKIFKFCGVKDFDDINISPVINPTEEQVKSWEKLVKNYEL